jgi:hypothetical protein
MTKFPLKTAATPGIDTILEAVERAEKRVIAISFLLAKIVSVVALLVALLLLETGVIRRILAIEFAPDSVRQDAGAPNASKSATERQTRP